MFGRAATTAAMALAVLAQEPRWFSAWAAAHNVGRVVPGLDGASVRLIVRPTLSGQSLRVKLTNIRGAAPAVFSAAFVGVSGPGATVLAGTNRRLTFNGAESLTLRPDESAWSDPVPVRRQSVPAAGGEPRRRIGVRREHGHPRAGHDLPRGRAPRRGDVCRRLRGYSSERARQHRPRVSDVLAGAVDVRSSSAVGTIVAVGDSWIDGRCSTTEDGRVRPDVYQRWIDVLGGAPGGRASKRNRRRW